MPLAIAAPLLALMLGAAPGPPTGAAYRPRVVIMPCQYFTADGRSAKAITRALEQEYEHQGYRVVDRARARQEFRLLGLVPDRPYADHVALRFAAATCADLVVYPRLLTMAAPSEVAKEAGLPEPAAVIHVRVLNLRTGQPIYCRQIAQTFTADGERLAEPFALTAPVAQRAVAVVTAPYFEQVAGSRQEFRR